MAEISKIQPFGSTTQYDLNATRLGTSTIGGILDPIYLSSGTATASSGKTIPFIVGTGSTAGTWLGSLTSLTAYYDGLLILYKPSVAGASTTTLNINSLGAKTVYLNNTTKLTTHYPANQPILLAYSTSQNSGCWMAIDNYDSNTTPYGIRVYRQTTGYNGDYPLLVSRTVASSIGTSGTDGSYTNNVYGVLWNDTTKTPTLNPSTGAMKVPGGITANLTGTASKATADANGNNIASTYAKKSELLDLIYPIGAIYISVVNTSPATLFGGTWAQIKDTFLLSAGTNHTAGTTGGSETVTLTTAEMPAHTHAGPSHTHTGPSHTHDLSSHYHWVGPQNGTANWVGLSGSAWDFAMQSGTHSYPSTDGIISIAAGGAYIGWATTGGNKDGRDGFTVNASHSHSVSTNAVNSGGPSNNTSGASGTGATGASGTGATSSTGSGGAHNNMPPYLTVYMWKRTA